MSKEVGITLKGVKLDNITPNIDENMMKELLSDHELYLDFVRNFNPDIETVANLTRERDALKYLLQEYKDLEEQGLLLRLPCKVGDEIWCVEEDDYSGMIFMGMCGDYVIGCSTYAHLKDTFDVQIEEMALESKENYGVEVYIYHKDDVFLTREEAENKLQELQGNE